MSGMNDDRRPQSGRSIREIVSDATDRELKDFATGNLTPDELVAMAAAEERRRKRRMRRISGIAALFVIVLACGAFFVFSTFTTDVDADKNPKEEIVTEDGVIIEDGGWGSSSEDMWEINNWDEVKSAKAMISELLVPYYIPNGYVFEKLSIVEIGKMLKIEYYFKNDIQDELIIQEYIQNENLDVTYVTESRVIDSNKGAIYIVESGEIKNATVYMNDGTSIYIWTKINDEQIVQLVDQMK